MTEQQRIQGIWLAADTSYGIFAIDPIDYPDMEVMEARDFYNELNSVDEDETIFAFFDGNEEELFNKIEAEYGIH